MSTYSSLGRRLQKLLQNQAKCRKFSQDLRRNIIEEQEINQRFTIIDEKTLITVQIQQRLAQNQAISIPNNTSKFNFKTTDFTIDKMRVQNPKTFELKNQPAKEAPELKNQCISDQCILQQNQLQQLVSANESTGHRFVFENFDSKNPDLNLQSHEQLRIVQTLEQYFELIIIDEAFLGDDENHEKLHQVKIFSQTEHQHMNQGIDNKVFNLSNFSSFNGINSNQNSQFKNQVDQRKFYQKEFVYLVKKIEMLQGKKLSQKGIQKIANQLQSLIPQNPLNQIFLNNLAKNEKSTTPQKKSVPKLNFSKKPKNDKNEKLNCDSKTSKKVNYETNIRSELKSKNKLKPLNSEIVHRSKHEENKQNMKVDFQSETSKIKKETDRSTSLLSYRVLMEKKKIQREKSLEKKNKIEAAKHAQTQNENQHNLSSISLNHSSFKKVSETQIDNNLQFDSELKSIKNRLKIILENTSEAKLRTLSFEFSSKGKNLQKEVEEYCLKNRIQMKNIKSICQALSLNKAIITIKQ